MTSKKHDDDTPASAEAAKQTDAAPKRQDGTQADEIVLSGPDGQVFSCPRPGVPHGLAEGAQFNVAVRHPTTRAAHAHRFVVRDGKAVPVTK